MFVMLAGVVWAQSIGTPASSTEAMYQAQAAGALIDYPPVDQPYGRRE